MRSNLPATLPNQEFSEVKTVFKICENKTSFKYLVGKTNLQQEKFTNWI